MTKKIEAIFREEKLNAVKEALYKVGIIGMNVLREGPFRLDFAAREIEWGGEPEGASLLDLIYTELGLPVLRLDVAGKRIDALCDTGSSATLDLSDKDAERLLKTSR